MKKLVMIFSKKTKMRDLPNDDFLIVALDYSNTTDATKIVKILGDRVNFYKVGMELFYSAGDKILKFLNDSGKKIFLDLKINDIPHTIYRTIQILIQKNIHFITLFTDSNGIRCARKAIDEFYSEKNISIPKLLNVSLLTSVKASLQSTADKQNIKDRVYDISKKTIEAGGDGVICSGKETAFLRQKIAENFLIINPGIRLPKDKKDDQERVVDPLEAFSAGADHIVVGRSITRSSDPVSVVETIYQQIIGRRT